MELTNKRETYSIVNSNEAIKLAGEITISVDAITLNGVFRTLEDQHIGTFSYREINNTLDKNFSSLNREQEDNASLLLALTVSQVKTTLDL